MIQPVVILFVAVALVFACVHWVAIGASLYWYYWWFDIMMHFWGGFLIAFGVFALTTFRRITLKPTFKIILLALVVLTLAWELFEWRVGLFDPELHLNDALQDILFAFVGGMLGYGLLRRFNI